MHDTFQIANYFIKKFNGNINLMKLQTLIYFAHGWSLFFLNQPLINEKIRLTKTGIRIDSIYFSLVGLFGNEPLILKNDRNVKSIKSLHESLDMDISFETLFSDYFKFSVKDPTFFSKEESDVLQKVIDGYGKYSHIQLFNMIHLDPHPFGKYKGVYQSIDETYISNDDLRNSFEELYVIYYKND